MSLTEDGKIFENPNDTEDLLKDHLLSQLNDKELEIKGLEEIVMEVKSEANEKEALVVNAVKIIEALQQQLQQANKTIMRLESEGERLRREKREAEKELSDFRKECNNIDVLQKARDRYQEKSKKFKRELQNLTSSFEAKEKDYQSRIRELQVENKRLTGSLGENDAKIQELKRQLSLKDEIYAKSEEKIVKLEESLAKAITQSAEIVKMSELKQRECEKVIGFVKKEAEFQIRASKTSRLSNISTSRILEEKENADDIANLSCIDTITPRSSVPSTPHESRAKTMLFPQRSSMLSRTSTKKDISVRRKYETLSKPKVSIAASAREELSSIMVNPSDLFESTEKRGVVTLTNDLLKAGLADSIERERVLIDGIDNFLNGEAKVVNKVSEEFFKKEVELESWVKRCEELEQRTAESDLRIVSLEETLAELQISLNKHRAQRIEEKDLYDQKEYQLNAVIDVLRSELDKRDELIRKVIADANKFAPSSLVVSQENIKQLESLIQELESETKATKEQKKELLLHFEDLKTKHGELLFNYIKLRDSFMQIQSVLQIDLDSDSHSQASDIQGIEYLSLNNLETILSRIQELQTTGNSCEKLKGDSIQERQRLIDQLKGLEAQLLKLQSETGELKKEVEVRRGEIEQYKRALENEKANTEKEKEMIQTQEVQIAEYKSKIESSQSEIEKYRAEIESFTAAIETFTAEIEKQKVKADAELEKCKKEAEKCREEAKAMREETEKRFNAVSAAYVAEIEKNKEEIQRYQTEIEKYKEEIQRRQTLIENCEKEIDNAKIEVEKYKTEVEKYKTDADNYKMEAEKYKTEGATQKKEIEKYRTEAEAWSAQTETQKLEVEKHKNELQKANNEIQRVNHEIQRANKEIKQLKAELENLKTLSASATTEKDHLEKKINVLQATIEEVTFARNKAIAEKDSLVVVISTQEKQASIHENTIQEKEAELTKLKREAEESLSMMANYTALILKNEERTKELEERLKRSNDEQLAQQEKIKAMDANAAGLAQKISMLELEKEKLASEKAILQESKEKLSLLTQQLQTESEQLKIKAINLEVKAKYLEEENENLNKMIKQASESKETLQIEYLQSKQALARSEEGNRSYKNQIQELQNTVSLLKVEMENLKDMHTKEISRINERLAEKTRELKQLSEDMLRKQLELTQAKESGEKLGLKYEDLKKKYSEKKKEYLEKEKKMETHLINLAEDINQFSQENEKKEIIQFLKMRDKQSGAKIKKGNVGSEDPESLVQNVTKRNHHNKQVFERKGQQYERMLEYLEAMLIKLHDSDMRYFDEGPLAEWKLEQGENQAKQVSIFHENLKKLLKSICNKLDKQLGNEVDYVKKIFELLLKKAALSSDEKVLIVRCLKGFSERSYMEYKKETVERVAKAKELIKEILEKQKSWEDFIGDDHRSFELQTKPGLIGTTAMQGNSAKEFELLTALIKDLQNTLKIGKEYISSLGKKRSSNLSILGLDDEPQTIYHALTDALDSLQKIFTQEIEKTSKESNDQSLYPLTKHQNCFIYRINTVSITKLQDECLAFRNAFKYMDLNPLLKTAKKDEATLPLVEARVSESKNAIDKILSASQQILNFSKFFAFDEPTKNAMDSAQLATKIKSVQQAGEFKETRTELKSDIRVQMIEMLKELGGFRITINSLMYICDKYERLIGELKN